MGWRAGRLLLVIAFAAAGLGLVTPTSSSAGCIGPQIAVGHVPPLRASTHRPGAQPPAVLRAGDALTVGGIWFFNGCNDTTASSGCSAPEDPPPMDPARGVELVLAQGGHMWVLGRADASGERDRYRVHWRVTVPDDVGTGPGVLRARTAEVSVSVLG